MSEHESFTPEGAEEFVDPTEGPTLETGSEATAHQAASEVQKPTEALTESEKEQVKERITFFQKVIENGKKYLSPSKVAVGVALAASLFGTGCNALGQENAYEYRGSERLKISMNEPADRIEHMVAGSKVQLTTVEVGLIKGMTETMFGGRPDSGKNMEGYFYLNNDYDKADSNRYLADRANLEMVYVSTTPTLPADQLSLTAVEDFNTVLEKNDCALVVPPVTLADQQFSHDYRSVVADGRRIGRKAGIGYAFTSADDQARFLELSVVIERSRPDYPEQFESTRIELSEHPGRDGAVAHDLSKAERCAIGFELANRKADPGKKTMSGVKNSDGTYSYVYNFDDFRLASEAFVGVMENHRDQKSRKRAGEELLFDIAIAKRPEAKK